MQKLNNFGENLSWSRQTERVCYSEELHSLYIIANKGPYRTCGLQFNEAPSHIL
jgi:hypothetical protein